MRWTRREAFGALGAAAGSCMLSSCTREEMRASQEKMDPGALPWPYHELDPETTAARAYSCHYEGHCMYGVFRSVIGQLADRYGEPYRSFPCGMMSYGAGGVGGWGSLCGALNGAAAAIALFAPDRQKHASLINRVFLWYEQTELPVYLPAEPKLDMRIPPSTAHSVLCHLSVSVWCKTSGHRVGSKEHMERCARLTADTARRTVLVLNESLSQGLVPAMTAEESAGRCNACHGREGTRKDALARMTCGSCHTTLSDKHPDASIKL